MTAIWILAIVFGLIGAAFVFKLFVGRGGLNVLESILMVISVVVAATSIGVIVDGGQILEACLALDR